MKSKILLGVAALLLASNSALIAQESVTLDTPVQVAEGVSNFRLGDLSISFIRNRIDVVFYEWKDEAFLHPDEGGAKQIICMWTEADGSVAMMQELNVANLSDKSLEKWIIEAGQAKADCGIGPGTISGTPVGEGLE